MHPDKIEYYHGKTFQHKVNVEVFRALAKTLNLELQYANKTRAPWHVYTVLGLNSSNSARIDFYPHKLTAVAPALDLPPAHGEAAIVALVSAAWEHIDGGYYGV